MNKRVLLTTVLALAAVVMMAVPAKRGLWRTLQLSDGTEVKAQLIGDEHVHYWMSDSGERYLETGEGLVKATPELLKAKAMSHMARQTSKKTASQKRKAQMGEYRVLTGKKKGLVILVEFTDTKFKATNNQERYNKVLNEQGYSTSEGFVGSVADYFKAQSGGMFELDFDVVGPVALKYNRRHYGENDRNGDDKAPDEMIVEACLGVDDQVDFSDYDWDGDGQVDQVFVLYAGTGEADGGPSYSIWPHEFELSYTNKELTLDGVQIDTYACSNEVDPNGKIEGIGVFCHEFSHCMGFPDFYDIMYNGSFGMSEFDLMDMGSYNGDGFVPAGYTAYEKMMVGWLDPVVLSTESLVVDDLQPTSQGGLAYIIYNDAHPDEYYLLENRQKTGWDAKLSAKGLMITHVDFDKDVWESNIPNSILTNAEARQYGLTKGNNHQRMTIFHADNDDDSKYWNSYYGFYTKQTLSNDFYPYQKNDSLTDTSTPAATLYNANTDGRKFMGKPVTGIKQNADKTVGFSFRMTSEGNNDDPGEITPVDPQQEDVLFYESFDQCNGTGGNDNLWNGNIASSTLNTDNEGWQMVQGYGADQCARFGTNKKSGEVTTPEFSIVSGNDAVLTFKAGAWGSDGNMLEISVSGNATIEPSTLTMGQAEWEECEATIKGSGVVRVTFTPTKRWFLDEVLVKSITATGIASVNVVPAQHAQNIYTIDGRFVGTDASALKPGIYIIGGRKVVR